MAENSVEQLKRRESVGELQKAFSEFIDNTHFLAGQAYGETGNRFLAPGGHNQEAATSLAGKFLNEFSRLYRQVPEGYHLDVGLTPLTWYKARVDKDVNLLTRKEMTPDGPRYYLTVGRYTEPANLKPNQTRLNLSPQGRVGHQDPSARLEIMMISRGSYRRTGVLLYPEDITGIKIVANPPARASL